MLYGLYDILGSVGPMWPDMTAAATGEPMLDVVIAAVSAEPFRCYGNIVVEPHVTLDAAGPLDAVVVCDMYTPIVTPPHGRFAVEGAWVQRLHAEGTLVASVCTGSLLLAEAGLLDGRTCAGHWAYAGLFQSAYPRIRFLPAAILDRSSEPDGIVTAGGVTSWQDLGLHLIARFCGPEHASRTAKVYLLGGHEDGQLPFSALTAPLLVDDPTIRDVVGWIGRNSATPNPVTSMAERSGLTPRTFARRFLAATGRRPIDHVHGLRIEQARELLELGTDTVDAVGYRVGYEDPTFFRRLFKRTTGLTPAAYRRKYAAILAEGRATRAGGTAAG